MQLQLTPGDYAISLARVSDAIQTSIPDQHKGNQNRAHILGVPIPEDGYYSDTESRSDASKWISFQQAMERIKDPHCKVVLAWQDSRIFGDEDQFLLVARLLRRAEVRLFFQDGSEQDVSTREGVLTGFIKGWQNQNEVIRTRQRVRDTHAIKAGAGRLISRPPYGIRVVPLVDAPCGGACKGDYTNCESWHGELSKKNTVWVVNEDELANLLIMYRHMARGGTWGELERKLATAGIVGQLRTITRSKSNVGKVVGGIPWTKHNMKRMLINTFFMGVFTWNRTQIIRDGAEKKIVDQPREEWIVEPHALGPLVPPELWEEANEMIARRSKTRDELRKYPTLLWDNFIYCGRCGWKMSPRQRANRTKQYGKNGGSQYDYACHGTYNPYCRCTVNHIVPEMAIDFHLGASLGSARMPEIEVTFEAESEKIDAQPELYALATRLIDIKKERDNLVRLALKGLIEDSAIPVERERLAKDESDALARQEELLSIPAGAVVTGSVPEALSRLFPLLRDESVPIDERRLTLSRIVDRIIVDRPRMRVVLRKAVVAEMLKP